ncbi:sensor histidine kinase [Alteraurantiacibacter buctensis]|uniref:sensor histidine kinase n=1 Tax=Alteraurantiacibacter buctensis TaxID=1503981 RepID=UPI001EED133A|nr:PAS domain-containing protein [Alteraurantiacibacter buctensis]
MTTHTNGAAQDEEELTSARNALRESDLRFQTLADAFPHMVWSTLPDGFHDYYNARWYEFTGVPEGSTDGEGWNDMFHPDDQERAWARWRHCLETGDPYEIEYRLRHRSGRYRWVLGRAMPMRAGDGQIIRWMGTCTDIHEQKEVAEQNEILSRELSHRIKNIFSVIGGLIGLSARRQPEHREFAGELQSRVSALGRAHELVRPHSEKSQPQIKTESLRALIEDVLSPYVAMSEGRIRIVGDDVRIDDRGATPIALLVHELATNAIKYGSLSVDEGTVDIAITRAREDCELTWVERGGPHIEGVPTHAGFGTRLAEMSVVHQLGGTLSRQWSREGLEALARVNMRALAR